MVSSRPLGDSPERSYANKLERFGRFVAPELKGVLSDLAIDRHSKVLDVGCGIGFATRLLAGLLRDDAHVVGLDLSLPHLRSAQADAKGLSLVQADASQLCFRNATFDLIWSCNTINHLADPVTALEAMRLALRPGGRLVLAQSGLLPEMYFAWDAPLDDAVRRACHEYYRARYGLSEAATAQVRALVGLIRRAKYRLGRVHTTTIERVAPLTQTDRDYFTETVFAGYWGAKLKPFLSAEHWARLERNIAPESPEFCLDRPDFHHVQTLTVCVGHV